MRNQDQQNDDGDWKGVVMKKEKFQGACANLQGHIFEARISQVNQVASYATTLDHMKTYICQLYDPIVLETIEKCKISTYMSCRQ